jgi:hypothetical protein
METLVEEGVRHIAAIDAATGANGAGAKDIAALDARRARVEEEIEVQKARYLDLEVRAEALELLSEVSVVTGEVFFRAGACLFLTASLFSIYVDSMHLIVLFFCVWPFFRSLPGALGVFVALAGSKAERKAEKKKKKKKAP